MLSIQNVSYRYGSAAPVLRHVSLEIARGERVALLGPSGYGKSTLALLLAGYLPMQEGRITLGGNPILRSGYCPVQLVYQHPEKAMDPRFPHELSGGQLQRLSILRALSPETRVLIADEITASLDPITQAQIWEVISGQATLHDMTLIVITHNEHLAKRICTRIVRVEELQDTAEH